MACHSLSFFHSVPPSRHVTFLLHHFPFILFHSVGLVRRFEDRRGRRPLSTNMYRVVSCLERRVQAHCGGVILVRERRLHPQGHCVPSHIGSTILRRCLVAPGEDACLAAAMWPTFYTHTLQSCPEGWTTTAMGVCHNPALPWRCPTSWTRLALPPFCSPNGPESESIPSLKCYAVQYADLQGPFCPYGSVRCICRTQDLYGRL